MPLFYLYLAFNFLNVFGLQIGITPSSKLEGSVCAYGDMNRDLYTDLLVHHHDKIKIYLQTEEGGFQESLVSLEIGSNTVSCAVGDFNGDSLPDVLVIKRIKESTYKVVVYICTGIVSNACTPYELSEAFADEPAVLDVNGDGISDLLGFLEQDAKFYCRLGTEQNGLFKNCEDYFNDTVPPKLLKGFPISFVDVTGDLSAEIIFAKQSDTNLILDVWSRAGSNVNWKRNIEAVKELVVETGKYFGVPLFADFDADGFIDIAVPICTDHPCTKVDSIQIWVNHNWLLSPISGLQGSNIVSSERPLSVVFRVGDFTLDGYPDLLVLVNKTQQNPMILENTECTECITNDTRTFTLRISPRLIQPSEVSLGTIQMASFFDLKEDGNLDVLLEYISAEGRTKEPKPTTIDFIRYSDGGDTTFLKVEVFSSSCTQGCGSEKIKIGSGIAWHGACISYNMTVSRRQEQTGTQCQMPQTSHRTFYSPFALFGLGRSPNFVDYVRVGSPRKVTSNGNQRYSLKQIVPNSRVIVVPPKGDDTYWQSRLYVTPSALIIQSLIVLVSVCSFLLLVIAVLHIRERRIDKQERQAQSHRFHFDAM